MAKQTLGRKRDSRERIEQRTAFYLQMLLAQRQSRFIRIHSYSRNLDDDRLITSMLHTSLDLMEMKHSIEKGVCIRMDKLIDPWGKTGWINVPRDSSIDFK